MQLLAAILVAALLLTAGCGTVTPAQMAAPAPTTSDEHVLDRSYTVGKEEVVFVGAPVARVKEYILQHTTRQGALHASTDFTMFYPPIGPTVLIKSTEPLRIMGMTDRDGKSYRLITLRNPYVKFLLNDDGTFQGSALGLGDGRMGWNYTPNPANVALRPDTSTTTVSSQGYVNFELLYSGASKDSIRLHYREFTQSDLVRPAFSQDLVYDRDSTIIRFRSMAIRVIEAGPERIRYIVLEDGYPPGPATK